MCLVSCDGKSLGLSSADLGCILILFEIIKLSARQLLTPHSAEWKLICPSWSHLSLPLRDTDLAQLEKERPHVSE